MAIMYALFGWFLNFNSSLVIIKQLYFKRGYYEHLHPKVVKAIRYIKK